MSEETLRRPRTWVLWVVRATLALTVLGLGGTLFAPGKLTGSFWWLFFSVPQVSIALLAVLICWAPDSRPDGLWLITSFLNGYGLIFSLGFLKWQPAVIGIITIIAFRFWPKGKLFIEQTPAGWPRL